MKPRRSVDFFRGDGLSFMIRLSETLPPLPSARL